MIYADVTLFTTLRHPFAFYTWVLLERAAIRRERALRAAKFRIMQNFAHLCWHDANPLEAYIAGFEDGCREAENQD